MTEQLHQISIPGLPDGWRAVAYRFPAGRTEYTLDDDMKPVRADDIYYPCLIVEKIQPRRIVLEETGECLHDFKGNGWVLISAEALKCVHGIESFPDYKIFREVKE